MTNFLERHPGGAHAILSAAGKDATRLFSMLHAPDALSSLPPAYCLGPVDLSTLPDEEEELSDEELARQEARDEMPSADAMFLLDDFEFWAERVLAGSAWAYYRSASDHEASGCQVPALHERRR